MIYFDHDRHVYYNKEGIIYDSPSRIFKKYKQKFDADEVAKRYAEKHGGTPEYWKQVWRDKSNKALNRGTTIHNGKEELDLGLGVTRYRDKIVHVDNAERYNVENLFDLPDGAWPEMNLWNHGWKIAGRPDKVIIETVLNHRYAHIEDYKTNRKIDKVSYWNPKYGEHKMMLGPLGHLFDCSWVHYMLQFSCYQYMLEAAGFKPGNRTLIHIPHPEMRVDEATGLEVPYQPADVRYEIPYAKDEILLTLNDYNRGRRYERFIKDEQ